MSAKVRLWRWRRNPLKRRSDVTQAWAGLAVGTAIVVGAPMAGAATAWGVQDVLSQQRQDRHPAAAVLTEGAPAGPVYAGGGQLRAAVRWTAPDGSVRTGDAQVDAGLKEGVRTTVWTDDRGGLTGRPPTPAEAETRADLAGALAAVGAGVLLLAGGRTLRWRLDRGRAAEWEREWAQVGPQWSRRRA
ncbi:hypothetical protein OHA74_14135 [Streptomyces phaeochromogenes]|uniref:Rv1733c family protein n=1 Tax=Streptomyces phaeochromogenes TaxID=1923 RepID=UPI002E2B26BF|nr:hypothetical protein [Streptomyces phaeochromogenes]